MKVFENCSLEQEMAHKAKVLESQHTVHEARSVDLTLEVIADGVESKSDDIFKLMAGKGQWQTGVVSIITHEVMRVAEKRLWCPEYDQKDKGNQRVMVYTGSHWEWIAPQQWKDFCDRCAEQCGLPETQLMTPRIMNLIYESVAFNLKEHRKQVVPHNEVWLNMLNGTLVIDSDGHVVLREHRKEDVFTYTLDYGYAADAKCELWHEFLDRVLPDADTQRVLAEYIGYCLMKDHRFEKMLWLYGEGRNGKSVTLEVVEKLLGSSNVSFISLGDLTTDDVKRAGIEDKMLNISHESGSDVNADLIKQLTSGEPVVIRNLYRDPRTTTSYGKFIGAFNILPRPELTFGYLRRIVILPYEVTIPQSEVDRHLALKLRQELPGILYWVLQSLPDLMKRDDFTQSSICDKALEDYRLQADNVRLFAVEMCKKDEYGTPAADIYNAYKLFCQDSSLRYLSKRNFYARLERLGFERKEVRRIPQFMMKLKEV